MPLPYKCMEFYTQKYTTFYFSIIAYFFRHEVVNINLSDKPKWLLKKNPNGTVPILETLTINSTKPESHSRPEIIIGSMECCEWLERNYKNSPALFETGDRARSLTLLNIFKEVIYH